MRLSFFTPTRAMRPRYGRLLVECMVAVLLIALSAVSLTTAVVATSSLGDDARQLAIGQREQGNAAGRVMLAPCDSTSSDATSTRWLNARHRADVIRAAAGPLRRVTVSVAWRASALASPWSRDLQVSSAAICR